MYVSVEKWIICNYTEGLDVTSGIQSTIFLNSPCKNICLKPLPLNISTSSFENK